MRRPCSPAVQHGRAPCGAAEPPGRAARPSPPAGDQVHVVRPWKAQSFLHTGKCTGTCTTTFKIALKGQGKRMNGKWNILFDCRPRPVNYCWFQINKLLKEFQIVDFLHSCRTLKSELKTIHPFPLWSWTKHLRHGSEKYCISLIFFTICSYKSVTISTADNKLVCSASSLSVIKSLESLSPMLNQSKWTFIWNLYIFPP